jgi:hypothetical protein
LPTFRDMIYMNSRNTLQSFFQFFSSPLFVNPEVSADFKIYEPPVLDNGNGRGGGAECNSSSGLGGLQPNFAESQGRIDGQWRLGAGLRSPPVGSRNSGLISRNLSRAFIDPTMKCRPVSRLTQLHGGLFLCYICTKLLGVFSCN